MELEATSETLYAISDLLESIDWRAQRIFELKLKISQVGLTYCDPYSYDRFSISSNGYITLHGSYSSRCGDCGETDFDVKFENFVDDEYLNRLQIELTDTIAEFEDKQANSEKRRVAEQEKKELEELARLKAKYEETNRLL